MLASCATFSKSQLSNLRKVHRGDSPEAVESTLGSPTRKSPAGDLWYYSLYDDDLSHARGYVARFDRSSARKLVAIEPDASGDKGYADRSQGSVQYAPHQEELKPGPINVHAGPPPENSYYRPQNDPAPPNAH